MGSNALSRMAVAVAVIGLSIACGGTQQVAAPTVDGVWLSTEMVRELPEVTVRINSGQPSSMTLKGDRQGELVWMELKLNALQIDGSVAGFQTDLPDNEGRILWRLAAMSEKAATLTGQLENADPSDDVTSWQLHR